MSMYVKPHTGEKRKEMRSPLPHNYIQNMLDKMSQGAAATAKATYSQQYGGNRPQPEVSVTYYGRGGGNN